ncbi:type II toxin-antitoxin system PemK/MazF family toxin, partial [Campylobacter coli]
MMKSTKKNNLNLQKQEWVMVSSKIVKYGELWIADFEPQVGEEITKKRPALILSNNLFNSNQKLVFVVPLTTWQ